MAPLYFGSGEPHRRIASIRCPGDGLAVASCLVDGGVGWLAIATLGGGWSSSRCRSNSGARN